MGRQHGLGKEDFFAIWIGGSTSTTCVLSRLGPGFLEEMSISAGKPGRSVHPSWGEKLRLADLCLDRRSLRSVGDDPSREPVREAFREWASSLLFVIDEIDVHSGSRCRELGRRAPCNEPGRVPADLPLKTRLDA